MLAELLALVDERPTYGCRPEPANFASMVLRSRSGSVDYGIYIVIEIEEYLEISLLCILGQYYCFGNMNPVPVERNRIGRSLTQ